ncbi:unnamed protein product [Lampetra planeri]
MFTVARFGKVRRKTKFHGLPVPRGVEGSLQGEGSVRGRTERCAQQRLSGGLGWGNVVVVIIAISCPSEEVRGRAALTWVASRPRGNPASRGGDGAVKSARVSGHPLALTSPHVTGRLGNSAAGAIPVAAVAFGVKSVSAMFANDARDDATGAKERIAKPEGGISLRHEPFPWLALIQRCGGSSDGWRITTRAGMLS